MQRRIMPKWDLHLVLLALMRPPFTSECNDQGETSDDVIPLKWRTMKTVFLLALASARRRSYIHALSVAPGRCVFSRGNTQRQLMVSLLPDSGFLVRNQLPSQAPQWISVPGIAHLNPSEAEGMLCPVRQLKLYLREQIRGWPTAVVHSLEPHHQRYHEKSYQQMDCGDLSKRLTHELIGSTTELQHMRSKPCQPHGLTTVRWRYLTFCQLRFRGHLEFSRIPISRHGLFR